MNGYARKDDIIKLLKEGGFHFTDLELNVLSDRMELLPEPCEAPRTAKWIELGYKCSNCATVVKEKTWYCPCCGGEMENA